VVGVDDEPTKTKKESKYELKCFKKHQKSDFGKIQVLFNLFSPIP